MAAPLQNPSPRQGLAGPLQFWHTHGGTHSPLQRIHDHLRANGHPGPQEITRLAREAHLPEATVRGIATFYADPGNENEITVCDGTSCRLAGSASICQQLRAQKTPFHKVSCLGHCEASPTMLDEHARVHTRVASIPLTKHHAASVTRPAIRCAAPTPLVTKRLLAGGAPDLTAALAHGAYRDLDQALQTEPKKILSAIEHSGLCGRGGGGFPTGHKWRTCAEIPADQRYVIANGDEGDPGSFVDRVLIEEDPHGILEGMLLCGHAVGASKGIVYIRGEYPVALAVMQQAITEATEGGMLGKNIQGAGVDFEVEVFPGMGSYVCGEETAMLNSLEGLRGEVKIRPPYPAQQGLYGKPTVVNNVETLVNVPFIVHGGAARYAHFGTERTSGTKVISLNHGFARPGLVEVEFGITLREIIEDLGGGGREGTPLAAVIVGGPMGSVVLPKDWDLPVCYDLLSKHDIQFGHGGILALPEDADFRDLLEHWIDFMIEESCGKCVPCRLGSQCAKSTLMSARSTEAITARLDEIFTAMEQGSLCAFGEYLPGPMRQLLTHFGDRIFTSS